MPSFLIARRAFCGSLSEREPLPLRCVREGQEIGGLRLSAASFIAAFVLALLNRILEPPDSPRGSVLAVVGCIPMIPGSLAAKGLMNLFELLKASPGEGLLAATAAVENLMLVVFTLVGVGTALAIPPLLFPVVPKQNNDEMA